MRILFVNHTFPPESLAGSEVYVFHTARELQRRGHAVAVFYRHADANDEEYAVKEDSYAGIPVYKINHTYRHVRSFQSIYINPIIAAKFGYLLREWKPDVIHFNHTTNLSMSLVSEAKAYGGAVIYTLHDYWLLCQRGQLLRRDLSLCEGPSAAECRSCLSLQVLKGRPQRWAGRLLHLGQRKTANLLHDLRRLRGATITTPDPVFVRLQSFGMGDGENETLQAHPPAEIRYALRLPQAACLRTAIGMHPHTYHQEGGGVHFEVIRNGECLYSALLNPKTNPGHQGWHPVEIPLEPSPDYKDHLILRTRAEQETNIHCTAGWRRPAIEPAVVSVPALPAPRYRMVKELLRQAALGVADGLAAFSPQAAEAIAHRQAWVQRVFQEVDVFIAPSRFLLDRYTRHGLPADKVRYSDYGFVIPAPSQPKPVRKPLVFGYLGTWIPSKGVEVALRAFQSIDPAEAKLLVYGFYPGGYEGYPDYDKTLKALAGSAVEFRGKYNPQEVFTILAEFDALIMPSIWFENSPLTIHEAFLARVPVITSAQGGMAELLEEGGGALFTPRDPNALRQVIEDVIAEPARIESWRGTIPAVKSIPEHGDELLALYQSHSKNL
ncbi:MAG: glycosyltransferase [bacterium]|jgi:glycosyltransferase involved in cell wall biosynthesis|nr:glycosyltransferase [bacterium]